MNGTTQYVIDDQTYELAYGLKITKGSGDNATTWDMIGLRDGEGRVFLINMSDNSLHQEVGGLPGEVRWGEENMFNVEADGVDQGLMQYLWGVANDGSEVLVIGDQTFVKLDSLVKYGPGNTWFARMSSPASRLATYEVDVPQPPSTTVALINYAVAAVFPLLCLMELFVVATPFRTLFWIAGVAAILVGHLGPAFVGYRAVQLLSFGFSLWLLTSFTYNLTAPPAELQPLPEAWSQTEFWRYARALVLLVGAWPLFFFFRRTFFAIADAARRTALLSLGLYLVGLFIYCLITSWFGWFSYFQWYYGAIPWGFLWVALFIVLLYRSAKDYRYVPLDRKSFETLRTKLADALSSQDPLASAWLIGEMADDLGDAIRLSRDPQITSFLGHKPELERIAKVFRAFAGSPEVLEEARRLVATKAPWVTEDLQLLSREVREMRPGGPSLRVSPMLRFMAASPF